MEGLFEKIINSPISIHVSFLIINIKIFYLRRIGAHLIQKKNV
jgi:hypothetical protein